MFCFLVKVLKGMNILRGFASSSQEVPQIHGLPNSWRLALFFSFSLKTKLHFCIFWRVGHVHVHVPCSHVEFGVELVGVSSLLP